jgi:hypothetical protein
MSDSSSKCPACGYQLPAMATVCEACGTEIKSGSTTSTISLIVEKFQEIEVEVAAAGFTGKALESEIVLRKGRYIRDIPVPNSREEILALVHYIRPRVEDSVKPDPNAEEWRSKFREVMSLAKNAFKGDSKTRAEFEAIEKSLQVTFAGMMKTKAKRSPVVFIVLAVALLAAVIGVVNVEYEKHKIAQCEATFDAQAELEKNRLDKLMSAATLELKAGKFTEALATASTISWSFQSNCRIELAEQLKADWDNKRQSLQTLVTQEMDKLDAAQKSAEAKVEAAQAAAASKAATATRKAATDKEF